MVKGQKNIPQPYSYSNIGLFDPILHEFHSDVSLYEQVMATFDPDQFAHLSKKPKISVAGISVFDGGIIEGVLSMAGKGTSKNTVITRKLSVAGSSTFKGMVSVAEKASIAGSSRFFDNAIFGGRLAIAGRATFDRNVVVSGGMRIDGRINVNDYLLADSPIFVSGSLVVPSIRSTDLLSVTGRVFVSQDIVARYIELGKAGGLVEGNIYAEKITVDVKKENARPKLNTVSGLFRYIKSTIVNAIKGRKHGILRIQGDVYADDVELDNVEIMGDVIVKQGSIGPGMVIHGTVYYEDSLEIDDSLNIVSVQDSLESIAKERENTKL